MADEEIKLYLNTTELRNQIEEFKNQVSKVNEFVFSYYHMMENIDRDMELVKKRLNTIDNNLKKLRAKKT